MPGYGDALTSKVAAGGAAPTPRWADIFDEESDDESGVACACALWGKWSAMASSHTQSRHGKSHTAAAGALPPPPAAMNGGGGGGCGGWGSTDASTVDDAGLGGLTHASDTDDEDDHFFVHAAALVRPSSHDGGAADADDDSEGIGSSSDLSVDDDAAAVALQPGRRSARSPGMQQPPPPPVALDGADGPAVGPSSGSAGHETGDCRPCIFFSRPEGCSAGAACRYCHHEHEPSLKRPSKARRALQKKLLARNIARMGSAD